MVADFEGRAGKVREKMQTLGGQGWLLTDPGEVRYVCGFTGSSPALVDGTGVTLFPHGVDLAQALDEVPWCTCIRRKGLQPWPEVVQVVQERGIRRLVAARRSLTVLAFESIAQAGVEIVDAGQAMNDLRGVKDLGEIESLRRAARIASEAFWDLLQVIRPGMSEKEIAAHLEHAMLTRGADGFWFRTIVVSGPRSAYCHGAPTERRVREGELVTIDFGPVWQGYPADCTRTIIMGSPSSEQRRVYGAVRAAQEAALELVSAGRSARDVHLAAARVIEQAGYGPYFVHAVGHGLAGGPVLDEDSRDELVEGNVFTVEPGIYIRGWGGVRIEDDVLVTSSGKELLTTCTRELVSIA